MRETPSPLQIFAKQRKLAASPRCAIYNANLETCLGLIWNWLFRCEVLDLVIKTLYFGPSHSVLLEQTLDQAQVVIPFPAWRSQGQQMLTYPKETENQQRALLLKGSESGSHPQEYDRNIPAVDSKKLEYGPGTIYDCFLSLGFGFVGQYIQYIPTFWLLLYLHPHIPVIFMGFSVGGSQ